MKRIFYILFFFFAVQPAFSQEEGPGEGKIREKMIEYIKNKLGLNQDEAEKFQPVFTNYFKDLRRTNKEFKGEGKLVLQQKVVELRLRYRDQFKPIIGEKRSNAVFDHEGEFIQKVQGALKDRREEHRQDRLEGRAPREKNSKLFSN
jgi:hypothetical protein